MTTLSEAWERYRLERPRYAQAAEDVKQALVRTARASHIPVEVLAREKDLGEFARKSLRKRYPNPWADITDKAGARAVVERSVHVDALFEAVCADPAIDVVEGSVQDKRKFPVERLDYSGVHLQVRAPALAGDFEPVEVEVQLRTKAQDCWSSVVSHRLLYKPTVQLPDDRKRRLLRLVAFMEVFDEEVDRVAAEIPGLESYAPRTLIDAAEKLYLRFVPMVEWDRGLSLDLTQVVLASIGSVDAEEYVASVATFVDGHSEEIGLVLQDYASHGDEPDPHYLLFDQPEIVYLYERLNNAPETLLTAWEASHLPLTLLSDTSDALGLSVADET